MTGHDYFRALLEVATVINSSLEPTVVLHKITEQTAKAMNCKASTLRLLDRTGKLLLASAAWGLSSGYMRKGPVEVAKSGLTAKSSRANSSTCAMRVATAGSSTPRAPRPKGSFPSCPPR